MRFIEPSSRLLDLGCGNGEFLRRMSHAGWTVEGLDPDPEAASAAQLAGLTVKQGFLTRDTFPKNHFDAVTLSHVIEHLHAPMEILNHCFHILRPGGILWIATPNLDSAGHSVYGANWIGLDVPRHLILFTPNALTRALKSVGFAEVSEPQVTNAARWYFRASAAIAAGTDPIRGSSPRGWAGLQLRYRAHKSNALTRHNPYVGEETILLATKPG